MCTQNNLISCQAYLNQNSEEVPNWLSTYSPGQELNLNSFFSSRVVYYPGSGRDGDAVKLFASSKSAHCFVYADIGENKKSLVQQLDSKYEAFSGYRMLDRIELSGKDIIPTNWVQHFDNSLASKIDFNAVKNINKESFAFLEILERKAEYD